MARLLQAITLAAGVASGATFSHRVHLSLKLECTSCHVSAAASARVEDNNLPSREVCRRCHESVEIKAPAGTLLSRFSHARHLKLGNVAPLLRAAMDRGTYLSPATDLRRHLGGTSPCTACHRGLEESDAVTKAAYPQMADCLVCHTDIDPPYSCRFCHESGTRLRPENHVAAFVDSHSQPRLTKTGCAVCHGRRVACAGCH